jgi:hypothetical protein
MTLEKADSTCDDVQEPTGPCWMCGVETTNKTGDSSPDFVCEECGAWDNYDQSF